MIQKLHGLSQVTKSKVFQRNDLDIMSSANIDMVKVRKVSGSGAEPGPEGVRGNAPDNWS